MGISSKLKSISVKLWFSVNASEVSGVCLSLSISVSFASSSRLPSSLTGGSSTTSGSTVSPVSREPTGSQWSAPETSNAGLLLFAVSLFNCCATLVTGSPDRWMSLGIKIHFWKISGGFNINSCLISISIWNPRGEHLTPWISSMEITDMSSFKSSSVKSSSDSLYIFSVGFPKIIGIFARRV